jgi:hypothetical protein
MDEVPDPLPWPVRLWRVEDLFRSLKSMLSTRPIYHRTDEAIRGHVFCSFLALLLMNEIRTEMDRIGMPFEWEHLLANLDRLQQIQIEKNGKRFALRTDVPPLVETVFRACHVALPPRFRADKPQKSEATAP